MPRQQNPEAVVFDMDGTLLDSESPARAAFMLAIEDLGFAYDADTYNRCIGTSHAGTEAILKTAYGPSYDHGTLHDRWGARFSEYTQDHPIAIKPGVCEVLEVLAARSIPMAVATSNRREVCEAHLEEAGLSRFFSHLVCADEAGLTKPAPDPYALAVRKLGVAPARSWAVEDSSIGVLSAYRAGLRVFHVPDLSIELMPANDIHPHSTVLGRVDELLDFMEL